MTPTEEASAPSAPVPRRTPIGVRVALVLLPAFVMLGAVAAVGHVFRKGERAKPPKSLSETPPKRGKRPPSEFGLPDYATGFDFVSYEFPNGEVSVSFLASSGSAREVADYYVAHAKRTKWQVEANREVVTRPSGEGVRMAGSLRGQRAILIDPKGQRQVIVTAYNNRSETAPVQVLVTTAPKSAVDQPAP